MGGWLTFWTWTLGVSVALFFLVEVVVVIGGAGNIKEMLAALRRQADRKSEDEA